MQRRVAIATMACVGAIAVIFFGYRLAATLLSDQVKIGCGPRTESGAEYCVYHRTTWGFLDSTRELLIGSSSIRGLFYEIPYEAEQTSATWDPATGNVTIAMPGTTLTITPAEYHDSR